jgi:hypothetical protein
MSASSSVVSCDVSSDAYARTVPVPCTFTVPNWPSAAQLAYVYVQGVQFSTVPTVPPNLSGWDLDFYFFYSKQATETEGLKGGGDRIPKRGI